MGPVYDGVSTSRPGTDVPVCRAVCRVLRSSSRRPSTSDRRTGTSACRVRRPVWTLLFLSLSIGRPFPVVLTRGGSPRKSSR